MSLVGFQGVGLAQHSHEVERPRGRRGKANKAAKRTEGKVHKAAEKMASTLLFARFPPAWLTRTHDKARSECEKVPEGAGVEPDAHRLRPAAQRARRRAGPRGDRAEGAPGGPRGSAEHGCLERGYEHVEPVTNLFTC